MPIGPFSADFIQVEGKPAIEGATANLYAQEGARLRQEIETNSAKAEAQAKAPILATLYSDSLTKISRGDFSGFSDLSRATAESATNPFLASMAHDASSVAARMASEYLDTERAKLGYSAALEREKLSIKGQADIQEKIGERQDKTIKASEDRQDTTSYRQYAMSLQNENEKIELKNQEDKLNWQKTLEKNKIARRRGFTDIVDPPEPNPIPKNKIPTIEDWRNSKYNFQEPDLPSADNVTGQGATGETLVPEGTPRQVSKSAQQQQANTVASQQQTNQQVSLTKRTDIPTVTLGNLVFQIKPELWDKVNKEGVSEKTISFKDEGSGMTHSAKISDPKVEAFKEFQDAVNKMHSDPAATAAIAQTIPSKQIDKIQWGIPKKDQASGLQLYYPTIEDKPLVPNPQEVKEGNKVTIVDNGKPVTKEFKEAFEKSKVALEGKLKYGEDFIVTQLDKPKVSLSSQENDRLRNLALKQPNEAARRDYSGKIIIQGGKGLTEEEIKSGLVQKDQEQESLKSVNARLQEAGKGNVEQDKDTKYNTKQLERLNKKANEISKDIRGENDNQQFYETKIKELESSNANTDVVRKSLANLYLNQKDGKESLRKLMKELNDVQSEISKYKKYLGQ